MSGSLPDCPIDPKARDWLERRWSWLTEEFGIDRLRQAAVVLPAPEYFPDPYDGTDGDARKILDRVCIYMGIDPAEVELCFYQDRNPNFDDNGQRLTAGLYEKEANRYKIWIEHTNLDDPLAMVATMAHEVGHIHLLGHGRVAEDTDDHEPLTDLLTVYLGIGVCTANAVLREHHWDAGVAAGWSMSRRGYLTMRDYGYALARFAQARGEDNPIWLQKLRPDVRAAFKAARTFIAADGHLTPATSDSAGNARELIDDEEEHSEEERDTEALTAAELVERYSAGERDFRGKDLQQLELSGADLRGVNLARADLSGANLVDSRLVDADLCEAELQSANLAGASLRNARLRDADLSDANLEGSDLTGADLCGADFRRARLDRCILVNTRRSRSTDMSETDLSRVICDTDLQRENLKGAMRATQLVDAYDAVFIKPMMLALFVLPIGLGLAIGAAAADAVGGLLGAFAGLVLVIFHYAWMTDDRSTGRQDDRTTKDKTTR